MKLRRLTALVDKEFRQILRDPSSLLIAVVLPVLLIFIFAYAVSLDVNDLKIGVAIEDDSPEAIDFYHALANNRFLDVAAARDRRDFLRPLEAGNIRGFVVIPQDFARKLGAGAEAAPIQIITDGSEPNTANYVENYVQGAWAVWQEQRALLAGRQHAAPPVQAVERVWYNPELKSRNFLLPGALALIMTLIGTLLTALVIAREWERGTMEALLSTGITRGELILGKLIPYFVLGMISLFLSLGIILLGYRVPLAGSFWVLILTGAAYLLCSLGMGLFISTAARNQFVACQIAFLTAFMPAMMLSGFIFEIDSMPAWLRAVCAVVPPRFFVECLHSLFSVGTLWAVLLPNLAAMLAAGALFFALVAIFTRRKLA